MTDKKTPNARCTALLSVYWIRLTARSLHSLQRAVLPARAYKVPNHNVHTNNILTAGRALTGVSSNLTVFRTLLRSYSTRVDHFSVKLLDLLEKENNHYY